MLAVTGPFAKRTSASGMRGSARLVNTQVGCV
jgi:hypothetical protein